jgi:hypothetical protein
MESACTSDETFISDANYLIFKDLKPQDDEFLLEVLEPFLGEINFAFYVTNGEIVELKEVNGYHTDKGEEVRKIVAVMKQRHLLYGNTLIVMSFGELYLTYGLRILQKLKRDATSLQTGSVTRSGSYPVEYLLFNSDEQ